MSHNRQGLRCKWIAANRRLRELRMIARAVADTGHVVMAHIIPMRRCNLACTYCNEFDDFSPPVPTEEMFRRVDALGAMGTAIITISGGEPLLHRHGRARQRRPAFGPVVGQFEHEAF